MFFFLSQLLKFLLFDPLLKLQPNWVVFQELSCIFWLCQYFKRFSHTCTFGKSWRLPWLNPWSLRHGHVLCFPFNPFTSVGVYLCSSVNIAEDLAWRPHTGCGPRTLFAAVAHGPARGCARPGSVSTCCHRGKRSQSFMGSLGRLALP